MSTTTKVECNENHVYTVDGRIVPGYSEVCADLGFPKNPFWTEQGRAEGEALSKWLLFLAQGKEPRDPPDERIAGRVEGIKRFFKERRFVFVGGETPLYCQNLNVCCTPDIYGYIEEERVVIEAKRGAKMKRHRLQTACQALALSDNGFEVSRRCCLYLKNGGYTMDEHDDEEDLECWRALVGAYHAKKIYEK